MFCTGKQGKSFRKDYNKKIAKPSGISLFGLAILTFASINYVITLYNVVLRSFHTALQQPSIFSRTLITFIKWDLLIIPR